MFPQFAGAGGGPSATGGSTVSPDGLAMHCTGHIMFMDEEIFLLIFADIIHRSQSNRVVLLIRLQ